MKARTLFFAIIAVATSFAGLRAEDVLKVNFSTYPAGSLGQWWGGWSYPEAVGGEAVVPFKVEAAATGPEETICATITADSRGAQEAGQWGFALTTPAIPANLNALGAVLQFRATIRGSANAPLTVRIISYNSSFSPTGAINSPRLQLKAGEFVDLVVPLQNFKQDPNVGEFDPGAPSFGFEFRSEDGPVAWGFVEKASMEISKFSLSPIK